MKNQLFVCALVACVIFTACNNKGGGASARMKKVTSSRGGATEYFYGTDNTLAYSLSGEGAKTTYKKVGNIIEQEIIDSLRHQNIQSKIFLNKNGTVDSMVASTPQGVMSKTYKHDANGFIVESRDYTNGQLTGANNSVIKDGNSVQVTVLDTALQPYVNVFFDYYLDKPNTMSYQNSGMNFIGTDSKNLIKTIVQMRPTGDTLRKIDFKYYFDDKGRVSGKVTSARGMVLDSSSVTYY